jgi:hypothetical protein
VPIGGLGMNHVECIIAVASVMHTNMRRSARHCGPRAPCLVRVSVVMCPSPDGQKPLRGTHWPALRVGVHPQVLVHTDPWACSTVTHHRSTGITQQVEHAHGNRAAQRSGTLGLSSAEVTILMRSNADTREIATLSPGGEPKTHQPRCVLRSHGNDHVRNVQDKTIGDFL